MTKVLKIWTTSLNKRNIFLNNDMKTSLPFHVKSTPKIILENSSPKFSQLLSEGFAKLPPEVSRKGCVGPLSEAAAAGECWSSGSAASPFSVTKSWWFTVCSAYRRIPYEEEWEKYQQYFSYKIGWAIVRILNNYPHLFKELIITVDISCFLWLWFKINDNLQALMIDFVIMFSTSI